MKCPHCKGNIAENYEGQTCPACGEPLPRTVPLSQEWGRRAWAFTEDRGFFFWLLVFFLFILFLSALEQLFGPGNLARLLDQHKFIALLMFIYASAHLKIIRNINSVVRPGYPGPYWTDRLLIKKFRRGTNKMVLLGFIVSVIVVGPLNFFALIPAYILIISLFTALFWSIDSFRIDDREFADMKVRTYFDFLGVKRLRTWRKTSGAYLICIVVSAALFYGLSHIPGLWVMIKNNPTLNSIIETVNGLFIWIPMLYPQQ